MPAAGTGRGEGDRIPRPSTRIHSRLLPCLAARPATVGTKARKEIDTPLAWLGRRNGAAGFHSIESVIPLTPPFLRNLPGSPGNWNVHSCLFGRTFDALAVLSMTLGRQSIPNRLGHALLAASGRRGDVEVLRRIQVVGKAGYSLQLGEQVRCPRCPAVASLLSDEKSVARL